MSEKTDNILGNLIKRFTQLEVNRSSILEAYKTIKDCYLKGGKVLICGNGGSAADSEHIVGELMKGFNKKRELCLSDKEKIRRFYPNEWQYLTDNLQGALSAISLVSQTAFSYAFINDVAPDMVFAQQVYGYGSEGDVLIGISTSGNSINVVNAAKVAKSFGLMTIALTGNDGGNLKSICDITIAVTEFETYKIQELHLPVYHAICAMLEEEFFIQ